MLDLWKETIETLMNQVISLEWYEYALMYFAWVVAEHAGAALGQLEHNCFYAPIVNKVHRVTVDAWKDNQKASNRVYVLRLLNAILENDNKSFVYLSAY